MVVAVLLTVILPEAAIGATVTETFRDEFANISYSGNNGTQNWAGSWIEQGESDGPSSGRVRVRSDSRCVAGNCVRIGGDEVSINGRGALRTADLSGATLATLTFSYRRQLLDDSGGNITVAVSGNGGAGWTSLASYNLNGSDGSPVPQSFDIGGFIGSATQIRFLGSGSDVESYFYADNVEISAQYQVNTPPIFNQNLGSRTDAEGSSISIDAGATDPDPDILTYSATGLPPGLSINLSTGLISGTIGFTATSASPYSVQVTVNDGTGGTDSDTFAWTITNTNRAPQLDPVADRTVNEGSTVSFSTSATDPDGNSLAFSLVGAPTGATINPTTGAFSWTPGETQGPDSYTFDVKVIDNGSPALPDTDKLTITVGEVNRAPTLTNPGNQSHIDGDSVSFTVPANDLDSPSNTLTYTATGLPAGLTINSSTGLITGTITGAAADASPYTAKITVNDGNGGTDSVTFTWTIAAQSSTTNRAPTVSWIGTKSVDELSQIQFTVTATDPDGDSLTFTLVGPAVGSSIGRTTGVFTWTPSESQGPGTYRFGVKVIDDGSPNLSVQQDLVIQVREVNSEPDLEGPDDQYSLIDEPASLQVVVFDSDVPTQTITYSAAGLPPGLNIDPATGLIEGKIEATASTIDPYLVTVGASDDGSPALSDSVEFTWTVTSSTQPVAYSAAYETWPDTPLPIVLTGAHPTGAPVTYTVVTQPALGNLTGTAPNLVYTSKQSVVGTDSVIFTVTDGTETSPTATITILILPPNQRPDAKPDQYLTNPNQTLTIETPGVLGNDVDPDGDALTAALDAGPDHGALDLQPDGGFTYVPKPEFTGTDTFTYTATDRADAQATTTVTIIVTTTLKAGVIADITSLKQQAGPDNDNAPAYDRTLVLMARATISSFSTMGFPLILLSLLGGALITVGRITILPIIGRNDTATGTISLYDPELGYGLITPDDKRPDVFFHQTALRPRGHIQLHPAHRVEYRAISQPHREQATRVRPLSRTDSPLGHG